MKISRKIFIITALATSVFVAALPAQAGALKMGKLNPAFVEYVATPASKSSAATEQKSGAHLRGYAPSPIYWEHLNNISYSVGGKMKAASTLPASFDLRPQMPAIRNQDPYSNCWTYAAMAATSSNLITQGLADTSISLSEWYLTYYARNDEADDKPAFSGKSGSGGYDLGGDDWLSCALLARGTGSLLYDKAPIPASQTDKDEYAPEITARDFKLTNMLYLGDLSTPARPYHLREVPLSGDRVTLVKNALMTYGALSIGISQEDDEDALNKSTGAYFYSNNATGTNHAVTIVGWDDNYAVANFRADNPPSGDGAWIVRNSWGTGWGDNGYYYVSYEEGSLNDGIAYVTVKAPENERIYQYDPLGCVSFFGVGETTVWFANTFTAKGDDKLTSVAFYTAVPNGSYDVSIYTGCDADSPVSGTLALTKTNFNVEAPGYNTVELPKSVQLKRDERFSVVIKATSSVADYVDLIPLEYPLARFSSEAATANAQESWYSSDGTMFTDVTKDTKNANVCIKAFVEKGAEPAADSGSGNGCTTGFGALAFFALIPIAWGKRK